MRKVKAISLFALACLLGGGLAISGGQSVAADAAGDFACTYEAKGSNNDTIAYGAQSVTKLSAAEAAEKGIPAGYSGDVLVVEHKSDSMGVWLDFSAEQMPIAYLDTMTFRVYVGDDGDSTDIYPEIRIVKPGTEMKTWLVRYDLSANTDAWVDITLKKDGTNFFSSKYSFEDLATDGYLGGFELALRSKAKIPYYIDSVSYTLVEDKTAPEITYNGEETIKIPAGAKLKLDVTAQDDIQGEVDIEYVWSGGDSVSEISPSTEGTYTLSLVARDYAGNESKKELTVVVKEEDTTAPEISLEFNRMYLVTGTKPVFSVLATDDSGHVDVETAWSNGALDEYGKLTKGTHTYTVTATDPSGNETKKSIIVYVTDEENLGDNVIDEEDLISNPKPDPDPEPKPEPEPEPQPKPEPETNEDEGGCGSVIGVSAAVTALCVGAALVCKKRKE